MPTVHQEDGFDFMIYTFDHEPAHVHVFKGGDEVVTNLGDATTGRRTRRPHTNRQTQTPCYVTTHTRTQSGVNAIVMPVVLRKKGFSFRIYTDDHPPPPPHVVKAGGQVIIYLGNVDTKPSVRDSKDMPDKQIRRALKIANEYQDYLLERWGEIHGDE